jgi:hypothetical protein
MDSTSPEKLRTTQFEYCKEIFQLELLRLKPKQLFPAIQECTNAQNFLNQFLMNPKFQMPITSNLNNKNNMLKSRYPSLEEV